MQIGFCMNSDNIFGELSWANTFDENIEVINNEIVSEEFNIQEDRRNDEAIDESSNSITKCICIEDIMKEDLTTLTTNEILQYECSMAYFIQALFEGDSNNKLKSNKKYDSELTFEKICSIAEYLQWISDACSFLAKKIGQGLIPLKNTEPPTIIRSSYNFCSRQTQCKKFYSKHQEPICTEHHYVHSLLKNDIDSVIEYLNHVCRNKIIFTKENLDNVYMSIKTICFVTRHMAKEISHIDYITKNNSELFHRNNPADINKKKLSAKLIFDSFKFQKTGQFSNSHPTNSLHTQQHNNNLLNNMQLSNSRQHADIATINARSNSTEVIQSNRPNASRDFNLSRKEYYMMVNKKNDIDLKQKNNNSFKQKKNSRIKTKLKQTANKKIVQNSDNNIYSSLKIEN